MKKIQCLCFFLVLAFFSQVNAYPKPEIRGSRVVSLGSGYKTVTGVFLGERVRGAEGFHGASMSQWKFKTNMGSAEKSNLINGNAEASISYGIFTASGGLDIDYINKKTNHSFSQTMYFDVVGKNVQLDRCEISNHFRNSMRTANAETIFGDCFVDSLTLGGRLILDITVAYNASVDSTEVNGHVELEIMKFIKGSASASVKIENILSNSEITVRAKQIGGDTTQLSSIFQGGSSLVSCSGGNYSRCSEIVQNVIQYGERFGRQLLGLRYDTNNPLGAAVIAFTTKPYESEGLDVFPGRNPIVINETKRLQQTMTKEYFNLIEDIKYTDHRINAGAVGADFITIRNTLEQNILRLVSAIENSAEYPDTTLIESNRYWSNRLVYQDPTSIRLPSELYIICDNCHKQEKLSTSNGKYRIMENGNARTCTRCHSSQMHFECRADDAVYQLSAQRYSGNIIYKDGVHFRGNATFKISDFFALDNLKTAVVEILR